MGEAELGEDRPEEPLRADARPGRPPWHAPPQGVRVALQQRPHGVIDLDEVTGHPPAAVTTPDARAPLHHVGLPASARNPEQELRRPTAAGIVLPALKKKPVFCCLRPSAASPTPHFGPASRVTTLRFKSIRVRTNRFGALLPRSAPLTRHCGLASCALLLTSTSDLCFCAGPCPSPPQAVHEGRFTDPLRSAFSKRPSVRPPPGCEI
jgi:hypothetical protein